MTLRKTYIKLIVVSIIALPVLFFISYQFSSLRFKRPNTQYVLPYYNDCIAAMAVVSSTIDKTYENKTNELGSSHFLVSDGFFMDINNFPNYTSNNNQLCANVLFDFLEIDGLDEKKDKFPYLYQAKLKYIQRTERFPFKRFFKGEFKCIIYDDGRKYC